jgi:Uma2 family endonuclease
METEIILEYPATPAAIETIEHPFTYADYKDLDVDDNFWYELINGVLVKKSAPTPRHQIIQANLFRLMSNYVFDNDLGIVLCAPVDVYVDDFSVPQPDMLFIAKDNAGIITEDGVMGAPNLVIEIVSPSSVRRDRKDKRLLYERRGVQEYWLVDPANRSVEVYHLNQNGIYELVTVGVEGETVQSQVLAGFSININVLFA